MTDELSGLDPEEAEIFRAAMGNLRADINAGKYSEEQLLSIEADFENGRLVASAAEFARAEVRKRRQAAQEAERQKQERLTRKYTKAEINGWMKQGIDEFTSTKRRNI